MTVSTASQAANVGGEVEPPLNPTRGTEVTTATEETAPHMVVEVVGERIFYYPNSDPRPEWSLDLTEARQALTSAFEGAKAQIVLVGKLEKAIAEVEAQA